MRLDTGILRQASGRIHGHQARVRGPAGNRFPRLCGTCLRTIRTRKHHRRRRRYHQGGNSRGVGEGHQHRPPTRRRQSCRRSRAPTAPPTFRPGPIASRPRLQGFQTANVEGIRLTAGATARVDVTLDSRRRHRVGQRRRAEHADADRRREGVDQHLERADRPAPARRRRRDAQRLRPRVDGAGGEGQRHERRRSAAGRAARSAPRSTAFR